MKVIGLMLVLLLTGGCITIQHPASPGVQYVSMDQCQNQHLMDTPGDCTKVLHQQATAAVVDIGATILIVLGYFAVIALLIAGAR